MKKPLHPVSDHAVLRYLERRYGVNIEGLRRRIGHKVDLAVKHPGAHGVVVEGLSYKIKNGVVTTVLQVNRPNVKTARTRRDRPE